jgi:hypothetical protein
VEEPPQFERKGRSRRSEANLAIAVERRFHFPAGAATESGKRDTEEAGLCAGTIEEFGPKALFMGTFLPLKKRQRSLLPICLCDK